MTGSRPDTRDQPTRPISVAELLAKNGTIGSPPVTGRRRRRRGNSDAVTVAELTGEIPVIRVDDDEPGPNDSAPAEPRPEPEPTAVDYDDDDDDDVRRIGWSEQGPRWPKSMLSARSGPGLAPSLDPRPARRSGWVPAEPEQPAGFPVVVLEPEPAIADAAVDYRGVEAGFQTDLAGDVDNTADTETAGGAAPESHGARWKIAKPRGHPGERDLEENPDDVGEPDEEYSRRSELVGGAAAVLQSIMAVAFGAGLFIGFDQLWRWNSIVALVLAMLVTLGLAAAVRVVRKTDDIGSTLTAVAVGLLVTLGPLALHAS